MAALMYQEIYSLDPFMQRDAKETVKCIKLHLEVVVEMLLCRCLSILSLFPLTSTNIFHCEKIGISIPFYVLVDPHPFYCTESVWIDQNKKKRCGSKKTSLMVLTVSFKENLQCNISVLQMIGFTQPSGIQKEKFG